MAPDPLCDSAQSNFTRRSRSALVITDTELKLIAVAAMIGDSSRPNTGYNTHHSNPYLPILRSSVGRVMPRISQVLPLFQWVCSRIALT